MGIGSTCPQDDALAKGGKYRHKNTRIGIKGLFLAMFCKFEVLRKLVFAVAAGV